MGSTEEEFGIIASCLLPILVFVSGSCQHILVSLTQQSNDVAAANSLCDSSSTYRSCQAEPLLRGLRLSTAGRLLYAFKVVMIPSSLCSLSLRLASLCDTLVLPFCFF